MRNSLFKLLLLFATLAVSPLIDRAFAAGEAVPSIAPAEALARLKRGNERFASQPVSAGKPTAAVRAKTATSQHPLAVVVACADSRTGPELVFDQNIGDLFVIRTAGNLVDDYALGSIEYAVDHLGTRLVVVLGHERCGAVKAALEAADAPGHVGHLVRDIQPAVRAAKERSGDALKNAVVANAGLVAARIRKEAEFGDAAKEVRVVTACYDLDTGRVEWTNE